MTVTRNKRDLHSELREAVVAYLYDRDGDHCAFCGGLLEEAPKLVPGWRGRPPKGGLTIDHITPLSKGGENRLANFRILHSSCNSRVYRGGIELEEKRRRGLEAHEQITAKKAEFRKTQEQRRKERGLRSQEERDR